MRNTTRTLVVTVAALALATAAFAQGGGQRREGGPPQGGPGMMMRGGPMGGPAILMRPDVQKELKLTEDQIAKVREIVPAGPGGSGGPGGFQRRQGGEQRGGGQGGFQRGQGGPPQGPRGMDPEQMKKLDTAVKGVLSDAQYKRYHELDLQLAGAMGVLRPDVAERLKLTEEQVQKIQEVARPQGGPRGPGGFRGGQGGERGQGLDPEQFEKMRKERDEKVLAVLTDAQLRQWHAMQGKKFEFQRQGPPPGGF